MEYCCKKINSPVGELTLIANDKGLAAVLWESDDQQRAEVETGIENHTHPVLVETEKQLVEFFEKKRRIFTIELDLTGTAFQKKVWEALLTIPFGETRTYGEIAKQINNPEAMRAVGMAANKNPVSIIVPCHRVIGASGKLVGFGGGLHNKSTLLRLENTNNPTLWDHL
ncbi:MAG: methylated-DNA--[protein]-cysteine S-methyltransferase [Bacteroidota bacterium]